MQIKSDRRKKHPGNNPGGSRDSREEGGSSSFRERQSGPVRREQRGGMHRGRDSQRGRGNGPIRRNAGAEGHLLGGDKKFLYMAI